MNTQHTTREKVELFLQDKLSGAESLAILQHLEECSECRQLAPLEDPQRVIERLLGEDNDEPEISADEEPPPNRRGMRKKWVGG